MNKLVRRTLAGLTLAVCASLAPAMAQSATAAPAPVYTPPKCAEDQAVAWFGKCVDRDDAHFRNGYWFNRPSGKVTRKTNVPKVREDQVILRNGKVRAADNSDYRGGYWYVGVSK